MGRSGMKRPSPHPGDDAQGGQSLHGVFVPGVRRDIGEGDGNGDLPVFQQPVKELGSLGTGHGILRAEPLSGVAPEICVVVRGVQKGRHAGLSGIFREGGRRGRAAVVAACAAASVAAVLLPAGFLLERADHGAGIVSLERNGEAGRFAV